MDATKVCEEVVFVGKVDGADGTVKVLLKVVLGGHVGTQVTQHSELLAANVAGVTTVHVAGAV